MSEGLRIEGLSAGYRGRPVFDGLDLPAVPRGSLVAIIGPNAAGKSTLLRSIAGLLPAKGRILLDGDDLARLPMGQRVRRVGYLPQALPNESVLVAYEAVLGALRATRGDLPARAVEAAVEEVFAVLELGALSLRPMNEMSGGQRQTVALAQVLVRRPDLMLLDEPTSALDLRWQLGVIEAVRAMVGREGSICLMAMHDVNLALRFCDLVVVLGPGRLIAAGTPLMVMTPEVLRQAYGVEGRVERCSLGHPIALADRAVDPLAT